MFRSNKQPAAMSVVETAAVWAMVRSVGCPLLQLSIFSLQTSNSHPVMTVVEKAVAVAMAPAATANILKQ